MTLKPCPFCGSPDIEPDSDRQVCQNCGATGPDAYDHEGEWRGIAQGTERWNTRTLPLDGDVVDDDALIDIINIVTDLDEVEALDLAIPEVRTRVEAIVAKATRSGDGELRNLLGDAFHTLTYIFECADDEQASKAAKETADKIDAALSSIRDR